MSSKAQILLEKYERLRTAADEAWGEYKEALEIPPKAPRQRQNPQALRIQRLMEHDAKFSKGKRKKSA